MKELKEVLVWDDGDSVKCTRRFFLELGSGCLAIYEQEYQKVISCANDKIDIVKWDHWEEIKEPKMRLMNQKEIWYAIQNMKHPIVVSYITSPEYSCLPQTFNFNSAITEYRWAELYIDGTHGNWKKFEVKE